MISGDVGPGDWAAFAASLTSTDGETTTAPTAISPTAAAVGFEMPETILIPPPPEFATLTTSPDPQPEPLLLLPPAPPPQLQARLHHLDQSQNHDDRGSTWKVQIVQVYGSEEDAGGAGYIGVEAADAEAEEEDGGGYTGVEASDRRTASAATATATPTAPTATQAEGDIIYETTPGQTVAEAAATRATTGATEALYSTVDRDAKKSPTKSPGGSGSGGRPRLPRPTSLAAAAVADAERLAAEKTLSAGAGAASFSLPTVSTTQLIQENHMKVLLNVSGTSATAAAGGGGDGGTNYGNASDAVYEELDGEYDGGGSNNNSTNHDGSGSMDGGDGGNLGGDGYLGVGASRSGSDGEVVYDSIAGAHSGEGEDTDRHLNGDDGDDDATRGSYASIASMYGGSEVGGQLLDLPVALMAANAKDGAKGSRALGGYDNADANPPGHSGMLVNTAWVGGNAAGAADGSRNYDPFALQSDTLPDDGDAKNGCCRIL